MHALQVESCLSLAHRHRYNRYFFKQTQIVVLEWHQLKFYLVWREGFDLQNFQSKGSDLHLWTGADHDQPKTVTNAEAKKRHPDTVSIAQGDFSWTQAVEEGGLYQKPVLSPLYVIDGFGTAETCCKPRKFQQPSSWGLPFVLGLFFACARWLEILYKIGCKITLGAAVSQEFRPGTSAREVDQLRTHVSHGCVRKVGRLCARCSSVCSACAQLTSMNFLRKDQILTVRMDYVIAPTGFCRTAIAKGKNLYRRNSWSNLVFNTHWPCRLKIAFS